jgi:transcriptional regulator with XRE-family HTH domain
MEKVILSRIGKNIRLLRLNRNMKQIELSKKCDLEKAALSRIEAGRTNLTIRTMLKISKALDIDIVELLK